MSPSQDLLSASNQPHDIYGPPNRLYATTPFYDPSTKRTGLLDPVPQQIFPDNVPIEHIVFNEIGTHLAVVDELGTIAILEQVTTATQLTPRQFFHADPNSQADITSEFVSRVVSLRWLHNDSKVHVAVKLSKNGDHWSCQSNTQRGSGPCNLVGKEALVAITSDGKVSFLRKSDLVMVGESHFSDSEGLEDGHIEAGWRGRTNLWRPSN